MPLQALAKTLAQKLNGAKKIAIVGIGSPIRGDDCAGLIVIEELTRLLGDQASTEQLKLISCETVPESATGQIRSFTPTHLIIVDAAHMNEEPGTVRLIDIEHDECAGSCSTHRLPIKMFCDYLKLSLSCEVLTIGIQPKQIDLCAPPGDYCVQAAAGLAKVLQEVLELQ